MGPKNVSVIFLFLPIRSALHTLRTSTMLKTHTHLSESCLVFALASAQSFMANVVTWLNI